MHYDYIVVGGGTSGCAVAARLSESGNNNVLVLETGPRDDKGLFFSMPLGLTFTMSNPIYAWLDKTVPTQYIANRSIVIPQGKVTGGSSSVNGMLYVRGHAEDYNEWAAEGCTGWSWEDVLPYFKRCQHFAEGDPQYHGKTGEVGTSVFNTIHTVSEDFIKAVQQAGYPYNKDYNNGDHTGISHCQVFIHKGRRQSASLILKKAEGRPNLTIKTSAPVRRIVFDGKRAVGVEVENDQGQKETIRCNKEIIISSGSFGTPHLLQHSGIGDGELLQKLGINVLVDSPEVGTNLQDQLFAHLKFNVNSPKASINAKLGNKVLMAGEVLRWMMFKSGTMNSATSEVIGFIRSNDNASRPDIQLAMKPYSYMISSKDGSLTMHPEPGITVSAILVQPFSTGSVQIDSPDPRVRPDVNIDYLNDERDVKTLMVGMQHIRQIMQQPAISQYEPKEYEPGEDVTSPEALEAYIRSSVETIYHPACSCRMGVDEKAVVDPRLRVKGVEGLRIADLSIMPKIIRGNTAAPALMIGEKAADMLLVDTQK
jgi:choline dehydrogenase